MSNSCLFNTVLPEGLRISGIQCLIFSLVPLLTDFCRFSESDDDIFKGCRILQWETVMVLGLFNLWFSEFWECCFPFSPLALCGVVPLSWAVSSVFLFPSWHLDCVPSFPVWFPVSGSAINIHLRHSGFVSSNSHHTLHSWFRLTLLWNDNNLRNFCSLYAHL